MYRFFALKKANVSLNVTSTTGSTATPHRVQREGGGKKMRGRGR